MASKLRLESLSLVAFRALEGSDVLIFVVEEADGTGVSLAVFVCWHDNESALGKKWSFGAGDKIGG
jgi:hypothetical protein